MVKLSKPKCVPKPYRVISYPSHRIQINVKFTLTCCWANEAKGKCLYQYAVIDKYSCWSYVEAFGEYGTIFWYASQSICFGAS